MKAISKKIAKFLTFGQSPERAIPLISWAHAKNWTNLDWPNLADEAQIWYPCPDQCSPNSYVLRVYRDHMASPTESVVEQNCPDGSIIYVDPDKRYPVNGEGIVAYLSESKKLVFRVFRTNEMIRWLEPAFETTAFCNRSSTEDFLVIGTVVCVQRR